MKIKTHQKKEIEFVRTSFGHMQNVSLPQYHYHRFGKRSSISFNSLNGTVNGPKMFSISGGNILMIDFIGVVGRKWARCASSVDFVVNRFESNKHFLLIFCLFSCWTRSIYRHSKKPERDVELETLLDVIFQKMVRKPED